MRGACYCGCFMARIAVEDGLSTMAPTEYTPHHHKDTLPDQLVTVSNSHSAPSTDNTKEYSTG